MIFLPLFALPVWVATFLLRRRVAGLVLLAAATLAVPLVVALGQSRLGEYAATLQFLASAYAGLVGIVGFALWMQRRPAMAHECRHCLYDLTGNATGVCPECGHVLPSVTSDELSRARKSAGAD